MNREGRRNTKVLIVDDNLLLASLLEMMLEDEGYETLSAGDGRDGYVSYLRFHPEIVITDLHMPKANGLDLIKKIRRQNPGVKTIYMSGNLCPFSHLLNEEKRRYPVSILPKPFSREELLKLLGELGNGGRDKRSRASLGARRMAE